MASLVIMLKDIYSKMPINSAVILCNGKQNPYTRKKEGYYVFSNLYPGKCEVSISCRGYTDLNFTIELKENQTQIIYTDMPYAVNNENLIRMTRFEISVYENKEALKNTDVQLKLCNPLEFLKLVEKSKPGSDEVKLNIEDMIPGIIGQEYVYTLDKDSVNISLWGYNPEKKSYTLKTPMENELNPGGSFYPIWKLKTDSDGKITMPLIEQLMKDDVLSFECNTGENFAKASVDITGKRESGEVFYVDMKLKKIKNKK